MLYIRISNLKILRTSFVTWMIQTYRLAKRIFNHFDIKEDFLSHFAAFCPFLYLWKLLSRMHYDLDRIYYHTTIFFLASISLNNGEFTWDVKIPKKIKVFLGNCFACNLSLISFQSNMRHFKNSFKSAIMHGCWQFLKVWLKHMKT